MINSIRFFRVSCCLSITLLVLLALSSRVSAESVEIYGVDFHYQLLSKADNDYFEVKSADVVKLVNNKTFKKFLIQINFSSKTTQFSFAELKKFTKEALAKNHQFAIQSVVPKFLRSSFITYEQSFDYFNMFSDFWLGRIADTDQSKISYELEKQSAAGKVYLFKTAEYYSPKFIWQCCFSYDFQETLAYFIKSSYLTKQSSKDIKAKLRSFLNLGLYQSEIVKAIQVLEVLELINSERGDLKSHYINLKNNYNSYFQVLIGLLEEYRNAQITEYLDKNQLQLVLDLVMLETSASRNELTHEIVLKVVSRMKGGYLKLLTLEPYGRYLLGISSKDYRIKQKIITLLERTIQHLLNDNNLFEAKETIEVLTSYRPNPSQKNSKLVIKLVEKMYQNNLVAQAAAVMDDWQLSLNFKQRSSLFFHGYYLSFKLFFLFILILCALAAYIYYFRNRSLLAKTIIRHIRETIEKVKDGIGDRGQDDFTEKEEVQVPDFDYERYEYLLSYFELTENATYDQIKSAYRQEVKSYHPDLNPDQEQEDHDRFLEMTKRYGELLDLYAKKTTKLKKF